MRGRQISEEVTLERVKNRLANTRQIMINENKPYLEVLAFDHMLADIEKFDEFSVIMGKQYNEAMRVLDMCNCPWCEGGYTENSDGAMSVEPCERCGGNGKAGSAVRRSFK